MRCEGMQGQLAWRMMEEQWRVAMPFYTAVALSFDKLPPQRRMMMATGIKLASSSYATQLSVQICLVFL